MTTDNFYTSLKLAESLQKQKTTFLSTFRKQTREVPNGEQLIKDKPLSFIRNLQNCIWKIPYDIQSYKKFVNLLSSMLIAVAIAETDRKKIPKTAKFYNTSKASVDVLDKIASYHQCETATRR